MNIDNLLCFLYPRLCFTSFDMSFVHFAGVCMTGGPTSDIQASSKIEGKYGIILLL
jgi:hypothetical protein